MKYKILSYVIFKTLEIYDIKWKSKQSILVFFSYSQLINTLDGFFLIIKKKFSHRSTKQPSAFSKGNYVQHFQQNCPYQILHQFSYLHFLLGSTENLSSFILQLWKTIVFTL